MALAFLALVSTLFAPGGEVETLRRLEAEWFESRGGSADLLGAPPWSYRLPAELTTRGLDGPTPPTEEPAPRLAALTVPVTLNAAVRDYLEFFQGRGRFIYARWLARMGLYREQMLPILEQHGVPPEMLYVCMIESGFQPNAVSRAAAVGPWQFILKTGRHYGLRHDAWVDERRDPVKATAAAARHLRDLYERYGSWLLVMAAYNAGVGSVDRAIARANSNDFWRLAGAGTLTDEATRYVPKAIAAMVIGQEPARYGFGDVVFEPPLRSVEVAVPGGQDLQRLARAADVDLGTIEKLNPELRRGFTPPDGDDYLLRVPPASREKLAAAVEHLGRREPGVFTEHRVKFGERLRDVAQRYGVSLRDLRRYNDIPDGEVAAGEVLVVPRAERAAPEPERLMVVTDPDLAFEADGRRELWFPVRRRMTVAEIGAFFGVSPGHIGMWNGLDPNVPVQRGMVLRLFVDPDFDVSSALLVEPAQVTTVAAGTEAAKNALAHAAEDRDPSVKRVRHTVKRGESMDKIARRYGVTIKELRAENGLSARSSLHRGQVLLVPQRVTPAPRGKAAKRSAKPDAKGRKYEVQRGDSLWKIARKHGVDVQDLMKRNGFSGAVELKPGQTIVIP